MGLFHVYVEAPDRAPETIKRLAETIGKKYGVPVADLEKRLVAGRFRVKANIDQTTADAYAKALANSGAIVKIEEAVPTQPVPVVSRPVTPSSGAPVTHGTKSESSGVPIDVYTPPSAPARAPAQLIQRPTPTNPPPTLPRPGGSSLPPPNAARPATSSLPPPSAARPATSSLPPANASRTSTPSLPSATAPRPATSSLPPATADKSGKNVASGLSAAYTESAKADLGALDSMSLASLDGNEDVGEEAFAPPVDLSPSLAVAAPAPAAAPAPKAAKAPKPKDVPTDLFAPPDAAEDEAFKVELAADEVEHRARKMSTPPAGVPTAVAGQGSQPVATPQLSPAKKRPTPAAGAPVTVSADAQETPRWRFAAGVLLAIILGFLPAHLIASSRESSAFAKIDAEVVAAQNSADTPELYDALDSFRDAQRDHKQTEKKRIAMMSMLIWAVTSGGLAYVWFRRVPWDKLRGRLG
jgi:hypothetical protein